MRKKITQKYKKGFGVQLSKNYRKKNSKIFSRFQRSAKNQIKLWIKIQNFNREIVKLKRSFVV